MKPKFLYVIRHQHHDANNLTINYHGLSVYPSISLAVTSFSQRFLQNKIKVFPDMSQEITLWPMDVRRFRLMPIEICIINGDSFEEEGNFENGFKYRLKEGEIPIIEVLEIPSPLEFLLATALHDPSELTLKNPKGVVINRPLEEYANREIEIKVDDLNGWLLNYAVGKIENRPRDTNEDPQIVYGCIYCPGQLDEGIIEKHRISVIESGSRWKAYMRISTSTVVTAYGETTYIAACRALVASRYGSSITFSPNEFPVEIAYTV